MQLSDEEKELIEAYRRMPRDVQKRQHRLVCVVGYSFEPRLKVVNERSG